ncbi:MAG TPA: T9SS type A sorting domain-containing protein [Bacteroidia bacterium]|nr:T9SS type A sorting domain-containing protein [Bacteroidia bacterium]
MKKLLLFLFLVPFTNFLKSQTIPNGGFENWNTSSYEDPRYYPNTSNSSNLLRGLPVNVTKVTDPQAGSLAIHMVTVANATDTSFGYFINGDPNTLAGGIPYTEHPTTITGFYKCNIPVGDTGVIIIGFKQAGTMVSLDAGKFYGVHNAYTPFTVTLNIPPLATPDTLIFGAASSNAFVWNGIPGSMLQLDNVSFTGVASQPTYLNGSFELWDSHALNMPAQWAVGGDTIYRSPIAHSGSYSLRLGTLNMGGPNLGFGVATTGNLSQNGPPSGGRPYTLMQDTLTGWYQYTPTGTDSATIWISCTNNTNPVGGALTGLPPTTGWTHFSIPFMCGATPDTLLLVAAPIYGNFDSTNYGNLLLLDDVQLQSSPLYTNFSWMQLGFVKVFPDPAISETYVEYTNTNGAPVVMKVMDESGRIMMEEQHNESGTQRIHIDLSSFAKGNYVVMLEQNGGRVVRKLVVQ